MANGSMEMEPGAHCRVPQARVTRKAETESHARIFAHLDRGRGRGLDEKPRTRKKPEGATQRRPLAARAARPPAPAQFP